jgi:hypothetical protein
MTDEEDRQKSPLAGHARLTDNRFEARSMDLLRGIGKRDGADRAWRGTQADYVTGGVRGNAKRAGGF